MSRHIGRNEKWTKTGVEEYTSDFGLVKKDEHGGSKTWIAFVNEGFGHRVCGRGFKRARNAMMAVEEAIKHPKPSLPPIHFPARIFD